MSKIFFCLWFFLCLLHGAYAADHAAADWSRDYPAVLKRSKISGRPVFAYFSGSNWCGICKKMSREILSSAEFHAYAEQKFEFVNLDFPRPAPKGDPVYDLNLWLKEQHEVVGFPTILILDGDGVVWGRVGYTNGGVEPFLAKLRAIVVGHDR